MLTRDEKKVDFAEKLSKHLKLCIAIDKGYQIIFLWYWVRHKEEIKKREAKSSSKANGSLEKEANEKLFPHFFSLL